MLQNLQYTSGPGDSLFRQCLEDIARDVFGGGVPASAFEGQGLQDMWEALLECDFFSNKGGREKASRWFEWHRQFEKLLPCLGMLKYVLLCIGVQQGCSFPTCLDYLGWRRRARDSLPVGCPGLLFRALGRGDLGADLF